jgi:hypothetical protein
MVPLAGISLLAPYGLLVCLLAVLPAAVLALALVRQRRVARVLRLEPVPARRVLAAAILPAVALVALGIAVARPVLTTTSTVTARTSSEIVFVADVSRSMSASAGPGGATRLDRAREVIEQLREAVPGVPAGITGLTDRALPYLFPTLDRGVFADTLERSVRIEAPPPQRVSSVATSYAPLASLVRDGFFDPGTEHRTCVLVTDGETRSGIGPPAAWSAKRGCSLIVVRVGSAGDRIFRANGTLEPAYRPEGSAVGTVERLARLAGGSSFSAGEIASAGAALRRAADIGPARETGVASRSRSLAPYLALASLAAIGALLLRGRRRPLRGLLRLRGHRYDAAADV